MANGSPEEETGVYAFLLVVLCFGLLGNILSFTVWLKAAMSLNACGSGHSNPRLFAVLSLSDAISILSFIVAYVLQLQDDRGVQCAFHVFIFLAAVFTFYSDYVTIVIGLQRLVAVWRPFSIASLCNARRQWSVVVCVFLLNLFLRALFGVWTIETHRFCSQSTLWFFSNVTELQQFGKDVAYVYMGIELLSLALLLTVNGVLLRFLWSARQAPASVRRPSMSSLKSEERGKRKNTQLIVAVSIPPILKCLMIQVVNIVLIAQDFNVPVSLRYCKHVVIVLSVSVNVLIYSYFGDRFRKKLRELCGPVSAVCWSRYRAGRLRRGSCSRSSSTSVTTTEHL